MSNIANKVIVVTGASSGIGEAAARLLAANGAKVVLAARRDDRLRDVVDGIVREGGVASFFKADVVSAEEMKSLAEFALQTYGRIDVWINNAGVMPNSMLRELRVDEWNRMIDVNIKGVLHGIAAALPIMRNQRSGHLINISSTAGHHVAPTSAVYSATKFAVRAISEGLRLEESPESGIRSTVISPGLTETELLGTITSPGVLAIADRMKGIGISAASVARAIAFAIGEPDDALVSEITIRPTAL